ncbi:MAG: Ku protein [Actinomycetota bacterium]|nr:MAG: Ku protein [Actinomycetota bacterium]
MARPLWTGAISFGLVSVPVGLYPSTSEHTIHFNQLQRGTADRIRYRKVNERTGDEVAGSDIVKGYDLGGGQYVVVEPEELDAVAPGRSKTIDVMAFVDLAEVDPMYFQKTFYLAPLKADGGKTYALLLAALEKTNRAGVAMFVMRGKQALVLVRAHNGMLVLEELFFADEIRDPREELSTLPDGHEFSKPELDMAAHLVEIMAKPWDPAEYADTYTAKVMELIEAKGAGQEYVAAEAPDSSNELLDLMEALRRSVEANSAASQASAAASEDSTDEHAAGGRHLHAAPAPSKKRAGRATPPPAGDVAAMTRADLDRLARDLAIAGRSKMSREELEAAVTKAQRVRPLRKSS